MPYALEFAREEGGGRAEAASSRTRKTFFVKKVVGLMLRPLTLRPDLCYVNLEIRISRDIHILRYFVLSYVRKLEFPLGYSRVFVASHKL